VRVASLVETCKLNEIEPRVHLAIVSGPPQSRLDELLPWPTRPRPPSGQLPENGAYESTTSSRQATLGSGEVHSVGYTRSGAVI
jgi:hypothetical protein